MIARWRLTSACITWDTSTFEKNRLSNCPQLPLWLGHWPSAGLDTSLWLSLLPVRHWDLSYTWICHRGTPSQYHLALFITSSNGVNLFLRRRMAPSTPVSRIATLCLSSSLPLGWCPRRGHLFRQVVPPQSLQPAAHPGATSGRQLLSPPQTTMNKWLCASAFATVPLPSNTLSMTSCGTCWAVGHSPGLLLQLARARSACKGCPPDIAHPSDEKNIYYTSAPPLSWFAWSTRTSSLSNKPNSWRHNRHGWPVLQTVQLPSLLLTKV